MLWNFYLAKAVVLREGVLFAYPKYRSEEK